MESNSSPSGTGSCSSKVTSEGGGAGGVLAASSLTSWEGAGIFFMVRGSNISGGGSWEDSGCSCLTIARGETGIPSKTMAPSESSQAFFSPSIEMGRPSRI
jgi:hypothetical protein